MNASSPHAADVGYTAGFYREMAPSHLAFAALAAGRSPGRAVRPKRVLELGFGQGFGLALLAAANPDVQFEGCDANREHVVHAQGLLDGAGLVNVAVAQTTFEEAAARRGTRDCDVIAMHGVLSWVSPVAQDALGAIVRKRLRREGLLYVSYNCLAGWAPLAPVRQLMKEVQQRTPGDLQEQLARALDLLATLRTRNAPYFTTHPAAARHVDDLLKMDRRYLVHEFLGEHWSPLAFSQVAAHFAAADLSYLATATLSENLAPHAVRQDLAPVVATAADPILQESLRDFAGGKLFRRDVFARGQSSGGEAQDGRTFPGVKFVLIVPYSRLQFTFFTPSGQLTGRQELYTPIADALVRNPATFDELLTLPAFGASRSDMLHECLTLLVHSGQVLPVIDSESADAGPARRFNRVVVDAARTGRVYDNLASPVLRTGVPVTDFGLLSLAALFDGKGDDLPAAAGHALSILKSLGRRPMKELKPIEDDAEAIRFLAEYMRPIFEEVIPVWRRLGML